MVKKYDPAIVASITTGVLLAADFPTMASAASLVYGRPIFTHEFASRGLVDEIVQQVLAQHPDMPTGIPEGQTWQQVRDDVRARYGETITLMTHSETTDPAR